MLLSKSLTHRIDATIHDFQLEAATELADEAGNFGGPTVQDYADAKLEVLKLVANRLGFDCEAAPEGKVIFEV
jgi:hypothetical protein